MSCQLLFLRVLTAGRQLAKSLELQSLNDLGFSKRYVRCLQVCVYLFLTPKLGIKKKDMLLYFIVKFYYSYQCQLLTDL